MNTPRAPRINPAYVIIRIMQRWNLLTTSFFTFLLCSFMVCWAVISTVITTQKGYQGYNNPGAVNATIRYFVDDFSWAVGLSVLAGVVLTIVMLFFKAERATDKKTIIDSFVILGFCLFMTVFSQTLLQMFIAHLVG